MLHFVSLYGKNKDLSKHTADIRFKPVKCKSRIFEIALLKTDNDRPTF